MLLKGVGEVQIAPQPMAACEMVLIRLAHVADLPSPGDLVKQLTENAPPAAPATTRRLQLAAAGDTAAAARRRRNRGGGRGSQRAGRSRSGVRRTNRRAAVTQRPDDGGSGADGAADQPRDFDDIIALPAPIRAAAAGLSQRLRATSGGWPRDGSRGSLAWRAAIWREFGRRLAAVDRHRLGG